MRIRHWAPSQGVRHPQLSNPVITLLDTLFGYFNGWFKLLRLVVRLFFTLKDELSAMKTLCFCLQLSERMIYETGLFVHTLDIGSGLFTQLFKE